MVVKCAASCAGRSMMAVLQALRDLADPAEGVYNATALLETRLSYIKVMLDKYQKLPNNRATAAIPGAVAHVSLAASEEVSGPNLLNSVVTAIKTVAGVEEIDAAEEQSPSQVQEPSSTKTKVQALPSSKRLFVNKLTIWWSEKVLYNATVGSQVLTRRRKRRTVAAKPTARLERRRGLCWRRRFS